jgi:hypothetical protein
MSPQSTRAASRPSRNGKGEHGGQAARLEQASQLLSEREDGDDGRGQQQNRRAQPALGQGEGHDDREPHARRNAEIRLPRSLSRGHAQERVAHGNDEEGEDACRGEEREQRDGRGPGSP